MSFSTKIILTEQQLKIVLEILQKHLPNRKVVVFGSRAKGPVKEFSDLDLCIMDKSPLSLEDLADLREDFSNSDLPFRVDIVEWANTAPEFRNIIENHSEELPSI